MSGAPMSAGAPLRVFCYPVCPRTSPSEVNPIARAILFGEGPLTLGRDLFCVTDGSEDADFVIFAGDVDEYEYREHELLPKLEYIGTPTCRHVVYDTRDEPEPYPLGRTVVLKPSLRASDASQRALCVPYLERVSDFRDNITPVEARDIPISFIGQPFSHRIAAAESVQRSCPGAVVRWRQHYFWSPTYTNNERNRLRSEYIAVSRRSRFMLVLPGRGLNSFRFFEALSLGVPPVLVSSDAALPFDDSVSYDDFCLRIPGDGLCTVGDDLRDIMATLTPERYAKMARAARAAFDLYLSPAVFLRHLYTRLSYLASDHPAWPNFQSRPPTHHAAQSGRIRQGHLERLHR